MPNGTLIRAAMPTITRVPTMALPKPPPSSKAVGGSSVNNCQLSFAPPRHSNMINTENKGTQAITVATPVPMLSSVLNSVRRSLSDRSS